MTRNELAELILTEIHRHDEASKARPRPKNWQLLDLERYEHDLEYGPHYSPKWFGDATATEAGRLRALRTVYRLSDAGLVTIVTSEAGRLARVRLTDAGREAVAAIQAQTVGGV